MINQVNHKIFYIIAVFDLIIVSLFLKYITLQARKKSNWFVD